MINEELSLRAQVFLWCRENRLEAFQRDNTKLYADFNETDPKRQKLLRKYKVEYQNEALESSQELNHQTKRKKDKKSKPPEFVKYEDLVQCPHCPGAYANEIIKFVGFRGKLRGKRHPKGKIVQMAYLDMKGEAHEGEAFPVPIVPVSRSRNLDNLMWLTGKSAKEIGSNYYIGILRYEVEILTLIFTLRGMGYENVQVLMFRGGGKTYIECWESQFDMKHFNRNILLLSETNARLKVGNWVYVWALRNRYLKDPEKFSRKITYQHFELLNGARMDIYKYSKEEMVGEHDYVLKLDDTVKKKWHSRPTDNEKMIEHFQSNINMILRTGLEDFGTRKFEGDPLQHRQEHIRDIVIIKQSPFIRCPHDNRNNQGTYDPCSICRDKALLAPEIHGYEALMDLMEEDYDSWFSEMMQDPHPKMGGMVEESDIMYENRPYFADTKMWGIGVDVAENWDDSLLSDMSAVISCAMWFELDEKKRQMRRFTFLTEDVRRMPFRTTTSKKGHSQRGIIETIDKVVKKMVIDYPNVPYIIAIERNGPGIVLIEQILREYKEWKWYKHIISDKGQAVKWIKEGKANIPLGIKHQTEKIPRINSELRHSIKQNQTRFTHNLEDTTFMTQLLSFPKGKHDDGPDAGGTIKDELNRRWSGSHEPRQPREDPHLTRIKEQGKKKFEEMQSPWIKVQQMAARKNERTRRRAPF